MFGRCLNKFQLVFGLFLRTGICGNTFRLQCVQKNVLKFEAHEVLLQNLCESSLDKEIIRRYVEPRSAHSIAYSVEKRKIPLG